LNRRSNDVDEKGKELMRHTDKYGELAEDLVKESAEEPAGEAQMGNKSDNDRMKFVKGFQQPAPVIVTSTFPATKISRGKDKDEKAKQIMRHMMNILRQMMKILQTMMSGMAEKDRTEFVNAIDQPASVSVTRKSPAMKINSRGNDECEMSKQITRQLMNILRAQMSSMSEKDRTELVKTMDQQMMNIVQVEMSGIADEDKTQLVQAIDQLASAPLTRTTPSIKISSRGKDEDEDDKSQMNILLARMPDMADNYKTELVMAIDQHAPDRVTITTAQHDDDCIKVDGLSKETLEKVKHIYGRARDGDEKAKEILRRIQNIGA
jgi:hypothetical protein